jgi:small GTP-binding protein
MNARKIVVLGDVGVGKSTLICRIAANEWVSSTITTVGTTFVLRTVAIHGVDVELRIWDTPGLEQYASQCPLLVRDAHACVVVYDASRPATYGGVATHILRYLEHCKAPAPFVVVAASKGDLLGVEQAEREADRLTGAEKGLWLRSFVVSAKTGEQVPNLVEFLAGELLGRPAGDPVRDIAPAERASACC